MTSLSEIGQFYENKSVLITGATGFMGKVLIEKLLRSCTGIKCIYVLIRTQKGKSVGFRLKHIFESKVFDIIRNNNENLFHKVVAIEGELTESDLGISSKDVQTLIENVSIVFHSAAILKFEEPLNIAVNVNLLGTKRIVELCHKITNLQALIYVSTAYSNCNRFEIDEKLYPLRASPEKIIDLCDWMDSETLSSITPNLLGDFPNTYTYTKALTETMLADECSDLPLAIIRPSVVGASRKEPFPGWVDSFSASTGVIAAIVNGLLRHMPYKKGKRADVVPVDTVINMAIVLSWFTATNPNRKEILFYNCTSPQNHVTWKDVANYSTIYGIKYPPLDVFRFPYIHMHESIFSTQFATFFSHIIPAYLMDTILSMSGRKPKMVKIYQVIHMSLNVLTYFISNQWQFSNNNARILRQQLKGSDNQSFNFDMSDIDWRDYYSNYILGIRKYLLKNDDSTLPRAKKRLLKLYYAEKIFVHSFVLGISFIVFRCFTRRRYSRLLPKLK